MTSRMRVGTALVAGLLGFVAQASAQVAGMPLFTNPRYGTGIRVHADLGQPAQKGTTIGNTTVVQAGVSIALGSLGIGANVGMNKNDAQSLAGGATVNENTAMTGTALVQLRLIGGGLNPLSLSVFGGASSVLTARDLVIANAGYKYPVRANFPVGAAVGLHVPLGLTSLNVWGAGRYVFSKFVNCPATNPVIAGVTMDLKSWCDPTEKNFRWAVGADLPLMGIFSVRAAYDSGKVPTGVKGVFQKVDFWGLGVSIGFGGMR